MTPNLDTWSTIMAIIAPAIVDADDGERRHRSEYPEDMQRVGDVLGLWDADGYLTPPGGMHP